MQVHFKEAIHYSVGLDPVEVNEKDMNQDTVPDIITANYGESSATLLLSNPTGYTRLDLPCGYKCLNTIEDDINGDSLQDILILSGFDDSLYFYKGTDYGIPAYVSQYKFPHFVLLPEERIEKNRLKLLCRGHFFSREIKDCAAADEQDINFIRFNPSGDMQLLTWHDTQYPVCQLTAIDIDQDGFDELAATYANPSQIVFYQIHENPEISPIVIPLDTDYKGNIPLSFLRDDLDRDGLHDIAIFTFNGFIKMISCKNGIRHITASLSGINMAANDFTWGDFDGNGNSEFVFAGYDIETRAAALNFLCGPSLDHLDGISTVRLPFPFPVNQQFSLCSADYNQDGKLDLVIARYAQSGDHFFRKSISTVANSI